VSWVLDCVKIERISESYLSDVKNYERASVSYVLWTLRAKPYHRSRHADPEPVACAVRGKIHLPPGIA